MTEGMCAKRFPYEPRHRGRIFAGRSAFHPCALPSSNSMDDLERNRRISEARNAIAARIGKYCEQLAPEEFERLVDLMTGVHYKYDVLPNVPDVRVAEYLEELRALEAPTRRKA